jgi:hypothetical protein
MANNGSSTVGGMAFYRKAFGAVELFRNVLPDGTILFVELAAGAAAAGQRGRSGG